MRKILLLITLSVLFFLGNQVLANPELVSGSALLVIDVQKAFSDPDGFSPVCREQADDMLPVINAVVDKFARHDRKVIYIKQEYVRDTEFDSRLNVVGNTQFTKQDPSAFSDSKFTKYLSSENITHLYVVGLAAEYCVSATVSEALSKGFGVTVIADGISAKICSSLGGEIDTYKDKGAKVLLSKDLL